MALEAEVLEIGVTTLGALGYPLMLNQIPPLNPEIDSTAEEFDKKCLVRLKLEECNSAQKLSPIAIRKQVPAPKFLSAGKIRECGI